MARINRSTNDNALYIRLQDGSRCSKLVPKGQMLEYVYEDVRTLYEAFQRGMKVSGKCTQLTHYVIVYFPLFGLLRFYCTQAKYFFYSTCIMFSLSYLKKTSFRVHLYALNAHLCEEFCKKVAYCGTSRVVLDQPHVFRSKYFL